MSTWARRLRRRQHQLQVETRCGYRQLLTWETGVCEAHQAEQPCAVGLELEQAAQQLQPHAQRTAFVLAKGIGRRRGESALPPHRLNTRGSHCRMSLRETRNSHGLS